MGLLLQLGDHQPLRLDLVAALLALFDVGFEGGYAKSLLVVHEQVNFFGE
jgi:hypothetical protein